MFQDFVNKLDPNSIFVEGSTTFIYTKSGHLYHAPYPSAHKTLLEDDKIWKDVNPRGGRVSAEGFKRRAVAENFALLGRIHSTNISQLKSAFDGWFQGEPYEPEADKIVLLWNTDSNLVNRLLKSCISALITKGMIQSDTIIKAPVIEMVSAGEIAGMGRKTKFKSQELSSQGFENWNLKRDYHTIPPGDPRKQIAKQQLGMDQMTKKHAWQDAMEKHRFCYPGNRFGCTSENTIHFKKWLEEN